MHSLYYLGVILFSGMIFGKIVSFIKLPRVTGYLIAGVLIGPSILNLIPSSTTSNLVIISDIALSFIAYSIGSEFDIENIKKLGKKIIIITVFEALGAVIVVNLVMIFVLKVDIAFSIVISSIAAATAPAATLMVIKQYNAKGPLVDTLLPVVAIDDAIGIIVFGISTAIAHALSDSTTNLSLLLVLVKPFTEIFLALLLGFITGFLLSFLSKKARGEDQLLTITIATLFITVGIALSTNLSSLLSCMMLGATVINISPRADKTLSIVDRFTPPIFIAFFTIAGVQLNLSILKQVGTIGIGYIIARVFGKILGAYLGCAITNSPSKVKKYLGLTLIPQAGVAIGLSIVAETAVPKFATAIQTIILSATVIYELIGPLLTKTALAKAGEIKLSS